MLGTVQVQGPYLCTLDPSLLLGLSRKEEHKSSPSTFLSTTKYNLPFKQREEQHLINLQNQTGGFGRLPGAFGSCRTLRKGMQVRLT